jgi:uncharacterized ion transporter superfamily protein YfcC
VTAARFPHPLTLLVGCILVAAALTYVVPAGEYDRREDAETGRMVVVPGSFHPVPANPLGPLAIALSIPKGIAEAVSVIAVIFLGGAAFVVVDRTGALRVALMRLVRALGGRRMLAIPICSAFFAAGGVLENMQEEIIALVPVLLLLTRRLGFDNVTAVAISLGSAAIGASFSPMNPFQVGIAQQLAEVTLFSGAAFRTAVLLPALAVWVLYVMRYASKLGAGPAEAGHYVPMESEAGHYVPTESGDDAADAQAAALGGGRAAIIMGLVVAAFAIFIAGLIRFEWGFDELSAVLIVMGILAGLIGRLGVNGTAEAFVQGFKEMAFAAMLVGVARAISVVLTEGRIIDSVVNALFTPLEALPAAAAAIAMMLVQNAIHVPVPSVSGQAALTMPILVPLSDLLNISRQVTILAYQYGAGLCELLTPTNGALMAVLAAAGVRYDQWLKFILPMWALLTAIGGAAILIALAIGLT